MPCLRCGIVSDFECPGRISMEGTFGPVLGSSTGLNLTEIRRGVMD
jgi:hypothetical protein